MKCVSIIAIFFLLTFSVWAGRFVETFDGNKLREWKELVQHNAAPGSWRIINGELEAISRGNATRLLTLGDETWRNYIVELNVKPLRKHGPGNIAIAAPIQGTWLMYYVIGDLPFLGRESMATAIAGNFHLNKSVFFSFEPSPFFEVNKWSILKLSVYGNTFNLSVNGKQLFKTIGGIPIPWAKVFQVIDPEFPDFQTGGVGFGLTNYTARFDNITIIGEGIPDRGGLSVMPRAKLATTWGSLKRF
ncbi:MAG: DUF1080 domain-containing protein [Candidatus Poribacteria bacterium]|nr:DUF1080 domain-containing protein [Candidatus Poribacteria bacterium]